MFLEGTSFATYLYDKQEYFTGMQQAIRKSSDYKDFSRLFYNGYNKRSDSFVTLAQEAMSIKKPATTADRILVFIFRLLDKYGWIAGIPMIIWMIWHFLGKG